MVHRGSASPKNEKNDELFVMKMFGEKFCFSGYSIRVARSLRSCRPIVQAGIGRSGKDQRSRSSGRGDDVEYFGIGLSVKNNY